MASGSRFRVGTGLELCAAEIQLSKEFVVDGQKVMLIDMPGFGGVTLRDTHILRMIAAFLEAM